MAKIRICLSCGNKYDHCNHCGDGQSKPSWFNLYDSEECKDLYNVVSGYNMGIKQKYEVKAILDKYNIVDFSKYTDGIKNVLNELFPTEEPRRNRRKNNRVDIDFEGETVADDTPVVTEEGISE